MKSLKKCGDFPKERSLNKLTFNAPDILRRVQNTKMEIMVTYTSTKISAKKKNYLRNETKI